MLVSKASAPHENSTNKDPAGAKWLCQYLHNASKSLQWPPQVSIYDAHLSMLLQRSIRRYYNVSQPYLASVIDRRQLSVIPQYTLVCLVLTTIMPRQTSRSFIGQRKQLKLKPTVMSPALYKHPVPRMSRHRDRPFPHPDLTKEISVSES